MYQPVDPKTNFRTLEQDILQFWQKEQVFEKLRAQNAHGAPWSFIDGPITANNPMGVHHAWGRTYKDIYQRYHAMQGHALRYQNGFDCQGLWVEVEVEKELGLNSKKDIEAYGLDRFSRKCRERVEKYSGIQSQQSVQLGQWMDWDHSYYTMTDNNIEHIWHFLQVCRDRRWLYKGHRPMPWCIRCGTSLSQHELIDSYKEMVHKSVTIRLPLRERDGEYMLVWTTTPWTLSSNVALAVHPGLEYVKARLDEKIYYCSKGTYAHQLGGAAEILGHVKGADLIGLHYTGPFDDFEHVRQAGVDHRIIPWAEVGEEEGTGVVHIAPGCGAEDFQLSREHNLAVIVPIDDTGYFKEGFGFLSGKLVSGVAEPIFAALKQRGWMHKTEPYEHRYPVCWRCQAELVFQLADEWFISCDEIRPQMIAAARGVEWYPPSAGKRMEDWLNNMGDWCISRKRYWGLPLPFYTYEDGTFDGGEWFQIGSRTQLAGLAISGMDQLEELHRPWIDQVKLRHPDNGRTLVRVKEVGDCWLDAGIVPFSTLGYLSGDRTYWKQWFPAEFITEMREQIRLWFYSMMFMSVTLEGTTPYRRVMTYEKAMDEHGKPMHKSHGNAIWFDDAADKMGVDVMRWIYASQNIMNNLRFGFTIADEARRKILTLWNTYAFFVSYANIDNFNPRTVDPETLDYTPMDRWITARVHQVIAETRVRLDQFDSAAVMRQVEAFIDDLSNWYVRRSRRRFWKSENDTDKLAAHYTLYTSLVTLARLLAPVLPFLTDHMYRNLVLSVEPDAPVSVHLTAFPEADPSRIDEALITEMALVRKVVELGRGIRNRVQIKTRQPLSEVLVQASGDGRRDILERMRPVILEELNAKELRIIDEADSLRQRKIKLQYRTVGKRYGKTVKAIEQYFTGGVPEIAALAAGQTVRLASVLHDGEAVELTPEDVLIETVEAEEKAVAEDGDVLVALNLEITDALRQEGVAREFIRCVQNARKDRGFDIMDKVRIRYAAGSGDTQHSIETFRDYICNETLAASIDPETALQQGVEVMIDEEAVRIDISKIEL